MDLGFVSLNTPQDMAPGHLGPELESRGFESIWVGEHPQLPVSAKKHLPAGLLAAQKRMWDPFLSLLAVAQATTRLRIGTAVALPLERELFTFAKEVATLDQMSQGRLLLGVGVGLRAEFETSRSIDWSNRYLALGDMVAAPRVALDRGRTGIPRRVLRLRPGVVIPEAISTTASASACGRHGTQGDPRMSGVGRRLASRGRCAQRRGECTGRLPPNGGGRRPRPRDTGFHDHGLGRARAGSAGDLPRSWLQPRRVGRRAAWQQGLVDHAAVPRPLCTDGRRTSLLTP